MKSAFISMDTGKPKRAIPVANGRGVPGAPLQGDATASPIPIADSNIWSEIWPAAHNQEIWGAGPDGTYRWRDQADGFYERGEER